MTHVNPNFVQSNYRIRSGDTVGLNVDSDWAANINVGATIEVDTTFRIRIEIDEDAGATTPTAPGGQIECRLNGGTYQNVTTTSSIMKAVGSGQFTHDDATTDVLSGSGRTFDTGRGSDTGTITTEPTLSNEHTEYEYCVTIVSGDVSDTDTIDVRVAGLNSYTNTVSITVSETVADGDVDAEIHLSWYTPVVGDQVDWSHPLARDLTALWVFNHQDGTTLYDLTGHGHDGDCTIINTDWSACPAGPSINFSADTKVITVSDHPRLRNMDELTLVALVHDLDQTTGTVDGVIMHKNHSTSTNEYGIEIKDTTFEIEFHIDTSGGTTTVTSTDTYKDGDTHLIVATWSQSKEAVAGLQKLYVDGRDQGTSTNTGTIDDSGLDFFIGRHGATSTRAMRGHFIMGAIYRRFFSEADVTLIQQDPFAMLRPLPEPIWMLPQAAPPGPAAGLRTLALTGVGV